MAVTTILASATAENKTGRYTTSMQSGTHHFIADEPVALGGDALGPAPADYICMALASCKTITMRMYAQRKNWKLEEAIIKVTLVKGDEMASALSTFYCEVQITGELNEEQRKRLLEISRVCPVDRLLGKKSEVVTVMV